MRKPMRASETRRRQMSASEFKAKCLRVLDEAANGSEIVITKRGKPVARLGPIAERVSSCGSWKGMVLMRSHRLVLAPLIGVCLLRAPIVPR